MELSKIMQARQIVASKSQEKVPAALAYKLMKFLKATADEEDFYNQKLQGIIEEYADRDKDGKPIGDGGGVRVRQDAVEPCKQAIEELSGTDVDAPKIAFKLSEIEPLTFSAAEMIILDDFIKEE